jgi:NAD/NADP transhydrogenase alpha subunit
MTPVIDCVREADVLEAVAFDRLHSVRDHLRTCASCAELAMVASAIRRDHDAGCREARVPSAGAVWWRATIRARAEAARTVSQPITFAQGAAAASVLGLAFGFAGVLWRWLSGFASVGEFLVRLRASDDVAAAAAVVLQHALPLALGLAACLVIAPLALYLALSDE